MGRIANGWEITKQSFRIIKQDKEILIFPVMAMALFVLVTGFFIIFFIAGGIGAIAINEDLGKGVVIFTFLAYFFAAYFISVFFEAAIVSSASIRLKGKNPSMGDGLSLPLKKIPKLFGWVAIASTVGLLLNILSNLGRGRGRGVQIGTRVGAGALGVIWKLMTLLTVPVLLFEQLGVFSSISRSSGLFKKTWGENITAQFSTGGIFFLLGLAGIIPLFIVFQIGGVFSIASLVLFFVYIGLLIVFVQSVNGILVAVLYYYAINHRDPHIYDSHTMKSLFK